MKLMIYETFDYVVLMEAAPAQVRLERSVLRIDYRHTFAVYFPLPPGVERDDELRIGYLTGRLTD